MVFQSLFDNWKKYRWRALNSSKIYYMIELYYFHHKGMTKFKIYNYLKKNKIMNLNKKETLKIIIIKSFPLLFHEQTNQYFHNIFTSIFNYIWIIKCEYLDYSNIK